MSTQQTRPPERTFCSLLLGPRKGPPTPHPRQVGGSRSTCPDLPSFPGSGSTDTNGHQAGTPTRNRPYLWEGGQKPLHPGLRPRDPSCPHYRPPNPRITLKPRKGPCCPGMQVGAATPDPVPPTLFPWSPSPISHLPITVPWSPCPLLPCFPSPVPQSPGSCSAARLMPTRPGHTRSSRRWDLEPLLNRQALGPQTRPSACPTV